MLLRHVQWKEGLLITTKRQSRGYLLPDTANHCLFATWKAWLCCLAPLPRGGVCHLLLDVPSPPRPLKPPPLPLLGPGYLRREASSPLVLGFRQPSLKGFLIPHSFQPECLHNDWLQCEKQFELTGRLTSVSRDSGLTGSPCDQGLRHCLVTKCGSRLECAKDTASISL